jgi:hypothetical protein
MHAGKQESVLQVYFYAVLRSVAEEMPGIYDDDSKHLQNYTKNLLNTLKEQQIKTSICLKQINSDQANRQNISQNDDSFMRNFNQDLKTKLFKHDLERLEKAQKTVSFNEHVNDTVTRTRRRQRRARSLSPITHAYSLSKSLSPKSILKKNMYDTDTDECTERSMKLKNLTQANRDTYIECLTKARQKHLNHLYNEDAYSLNDSFRNKAPVSKVAGLKP